MIKSSDTRFILGLIVGFYLLEVGGSTSDENVNACFTIPIVTLYPNENFPLNSCISPPVPSVNCLKEKIHTTVSVVYNTVDLNNMDNLSSNSNIHCLNDKKSTLFYRTTVHYRGDSSLGWKKHQLEMSLLDNDKSLLNFPFGKKWVLHGPYIDGSLLRNHLAHWLYRNTGRYSPRTQHVILFKQEPNENKPHYMGIYLLLEKISYEKSRVGLAPTTPECFKKGYKGGWAWQKNPLRYGVYSPNLVWNEYSNEYGSGQRPVLEYPKGSKLSQTMRNYFVNTSTGPLPLYFQYLFCNFSLTSELQNHIDIGSFVDYTLHSEMSLNQDAYSRSVWYFKDQDEPINAGPVWDFNLAYGLGSMAQKPNVGWIMNTFLSWKRLKCNYIFASLAISRWKTLRLGPWSDSTIIQFINNAANPLRQILKNCSGNWKDKGLYCAHVGSSNPQTFEEAVDILLNSTLKRAQWMDHHIVEFYSNLNASVCGQSSENLPQYNCAKDGNDSGCLDQPERYWSSIPFPPVHTPYNGPMECTLSKNEKLSSLEQPSIDPCWYSVGTYVTNGSITPFCSGFGTCPNGPNAKCQCNNNSTLSNCSFIVHETSHSSTSLNWLSTIGNIVILVLLGLLIILFGVFLYLCIKKQCFPNASRSSSSSSLLMSISTSKDYGT